jgi:tetratricopeptide (TPR) repeat protein
LAAAPWRLDHCRPANLSFKQGYTESALEVALPQTFSRRFDRAILLMEAGELEDAENLFKQLVAEKHLFKRDNYQSSEPLFYLGKIAALAGDKNRAINYLQRALQHSPGDPYALAYLAALTEQDEFREKLLRYFDEIDAQFYLGQAYLEIGLGERAEESFSYVSRMIPEYRRGLIYLSAALVEAGQNSRAVKMYHEAQKMSQDPVMLEKPILRAFQELAKEFPQDAIRQYDYGMALRQFGYYNQALLVQKDALRLDPSNEEIEKEIKFLIRRTGD